MSNKVYKEYSTKTKRNGSMADKIKQNGIFYIYVLPLLVMVIMFGIWPIAKSISLSFADSYSALTSVPKFVGLKNYKTIFSDSYFINSLWITIKFTLISVPVNIVLAFFFSLALSSKLVKYGKTFFKLAVFIPVITSELVVSIIWRWMYQKDFGAVNAVLNALNLPVFGGLASTKTVLAALIIVTLWKNVGFYTIIFLTNMQLIDPTYYEVVDIDGANFWQRLWYITIPELRPAITLNAVYAVIQFLKIFTVSRIMTQGGPNYASNFVAYYAYDKFASNQYGESTAMATVLFLFIIIIFSGTLWLSKRGDK